MDSADKSRFFGGTQSVAERRHRNDVRNKKRIILRYAAQLRRIKTLHKHTSCTVGRVQRLSYFGNHTCFVKIFCRNLVNVLVYLCHKEYSSVVVFYRFFDRIYRPIPRYIKVQYHTRKYYKSTQCECRHSYVLIFHISLSFLVVVYK